MPISHTVTFAEIQGTSDPGPLRQLAREAAAASLGARVLQGRAQPDVWLLMIDGDPNDAGIDVGARLASAGTKVQVWTFDDVALEPGS